MRGEGALEKAMIKGGHSASAGTESCFSQGGVWRAGMSCVKPLPAILQSELNITTATASSCCLRR